MKKFPILFALLFFFSISCSFAQSTIEIPAENSFELDYTGFEMYEATLKNKSLKGIEVKVLNKANNELMRGFGLGVKGKVEVLVEKESKLVLINPNKTSAKIVVNYTPKDPSIMMKPNPENYISFTLKNASSKSIPLIIPTVMNPNLSPNSNSGVDLKVGQEILFKAKGKKYVLLTVDNSIAAGSSIEVSKLLKERKRELGL